MSLRRRLACSRPRSVALAVADRRARLLPGRPRPAARPGRQRAARAGGASSSSYGQISRTAARHPGERRRPGSVRADRVLANGQSGCTSGNVIAPGRPRSTLQVATDAPRGSFFSDVDRRQDHLRVLTFHVTVARSAACRRPAALQLARPLNGVDGVLSKLRLVLLLVFLGGIALAAALGRLAGPAGAGAAGRGRADGRSTSARPRI